MKIIQIGTISIRDPEGNFLQAVPIYRKKGSEKKVNERIAKVFTSKYAEYKAALALSQKE